MGAEQLRPQVNISVIQIDIVGDDYLLTHRGYNRWFVDFCRVEGTFIAETLISGFDFRWIQQIGGSRIGGVIFGITRIIQVVDKLGMIIVWWHGRDEGGPLNWFY